MGSQSTGRGGFANFFSKAAPGDHSTAPAEVRPSGEYHSSGRGGVGNLVHNSEN